MQIGIEFGHDLQKRAVRVNTSVSFIKSSAKLLGYLRYSKLAAKKGKTIRSMAHGSTIVASQRKTTTRDSQAAALCYAAGDSKRAGGSKAASIYISIYIQQAQRPTKASASACAKVCSTPKNKSDAHAKPVATEESFSSGLQKGFLVQMSKEATKTRAHNRPQFQGE